MYCRLEHQALAARNFKCQCSSHVTLRLGQLLLGLALSSQVQSELKLESTQHVSSLADKTVSRVKSVCSVVGTKSKNTKRRRHASITAYKGYRGYRRHLILFSNFRFLTSGRNLLVDCHFLGDCYNLTEI